MAQPDPPQDRWSQRGRWNISVPPSAPPSSGPETKPVIPIPAPGSKPSPEQIEMLKSVDATQVISGSGMRPVTDFERTVRIPLPDLTLPSIPVQNQQFATASSILVPTGLPPLPVAPSRQAEEVSRAEEATKSFVTSPFQISQAPTVAPPPSQPSPDAMQRFEQGMGQMQRLGTHVVPTGAPLPRRVEQPVPQPFAPPPVPPVELKPRSWSLESLLIPLLIVALLMLIVMGYLLLTTVPTTR